MTLLRTLWHEHMPILLLILLHLISGYGLQAYLDQPIMNMALSYEVVNLFVVLFAVCFLSGHALWCLPRVPDGESAFKFIYQDLKTVWLTPQRLLGYAIVHLCLPFFMSTFQCIKIAIPAVVPFSWDVAFHDWDVALHGGRMPWEWLQFLGGDGPTLWLNIAYNLWFFVLFGLVVWQGFSMNRALRFRFLFSFLVIFIIGGNLLAMALASVGPCFWGLELGQPDPYGPLMERLHATNGRFLQANGVDGVHLWSMDVQEQLWAVYDTNTFETVGGISAMPSMHVASAVLFACLGWAHSKPLGIALTAFAVIIQIGSVHLGWHYAVDGYIGGALTLAVWFGVGWVMKKTGYLQPGPA